MALALSAAAVLAANTLCWRLGAGFVLPARSAAAGSEARAAADLAAEASPRRRDALAAAAAALLVAGAPGQVRAEQQLLSFNDEVIIGPPSKLQRVVVNVGDKQALAKELKFWTGALKMQKLGEYVDAAGLESTVVGFPSEGKEGAFGMEFKVDPAVLTRKPASILNYNVMQPFVNSLNFVQVGFRGKAMEAFKAVQASGGDSLIGDAQYLDVESPRGVQMRMAMRKEGEPAVELVGLNVEVTNFEDAKRFYIRTLGFKEIPYPEDEPSVQPLSVLLEPQSGPRLLLSPIPVGRLKELDLDEFENLVAVAPDVQATQRAAEKAMEAAAKEDAGKEEKLKFLLQQATQDSERDKVRAAIELRRRNGNGVKPSIQASGSTVLFNDGVGNMISLVSASDFSKSLQSVQPA